MGPNKAPTKLEREWMDAISKIGCLACKKVDRFRRAEVHHVVVGNRRLGHMYTIPVCDWHHRGVMPDGLSQADCREALGPSFARDKEQFTQRYGDEMKLLDQTSRLVKEMTGRDFHDEFQSKRKKSGAGASQPTAR